MSPLPLGACLLAAITTLPVAALDPIPGKAYLLTGPNGRTTWFLGKTAEKAGWLELANVRDMANTINSPWGERAWGTQEYTVPATVVVLHVGFVIASYDGTKGESVDVAMVRLREGAVAPVEGWVAQSLLQLLPEEVAQRRAAEKAALAKRTAEAAKIAAMPKLFSPAGTVIVATSADCARDLLNIVAFGERNGTGIEFRKKLVELATVGCSKTMASGTPVTIQRRDAQFVWFKTYPRGLDGIALTRSVIVNTP